MATFLTNVAFPDSRADLSGSTAEGYVIGFPVIIDALNQQV
jgi:hypothetical protein